MSFWHRLLYLLGFQQDPHPHPYNLNSDLHLIIADLARQEQRSPEELAEHLLSQAVQQRHETQALWQRWLSLSTREQQVAALACLGYTNKEIGLRLGVSGETVKTHLRNALIKFNLKTRSELRMLLSDWDFSAWERQI